MSEVDPFNNPELAHPRARELMKEDFFWDCVDEWAPFGSDEGNDAYYEWRNWREKNPNKELIECFSWVLDGRLDDYNESLITDERIDKDIEDPGSSFLSDGYDVFTLDATIIATALGQLLDEGKIDNNAKPFINIAIKRQSHPRVYQDSDRLKILKAN